MKRVLKKLVVHKETVRTLTPTELSTIVGGTEAISPKDTPIGCLGAAATKDCAS